MEDLSKLTYKISDWIDKHWKALGAIFVILSFIVITFLSQPKILELILVIANLIFAIYYYISLSGDSPKLLFKKDTKGNSKHNQKTYCKELDIDPNKEIGGKTNPLHKEERANELVKQFNNHIRDYVFYLVIVYLFFIIQYSLELSIEELNQSQKNGLFKLFFKSIIDGANYLSAISIYLGFRVLYDKTLNDENKPLKYNSETNVFSIIYFSLR
jgi:hypothetical protein